LRRLKLHTTIVQRSDKLMDRELDDRGSAILRKYLEEFGIEVVTGATATTIRGHDRVAEVDLSNGISLAAELVVACAGVRANTDLAIAAGLKVNCGVIVDHQMRTSDPKIFAAGDVAELPGSIGGLWTVSTKQAEVAAAAIFGKDCAYQAPSALVSLKSDGIDVKGFGSRNGGAGIEEIVQADEPETVHRRLFVRDGIVTGAVFVGPPGIGKDIVRVIQERVNLSPVLNRLRRFDWRALADA